MRVINTIAELRKELADQRGVVLVPTMGNLHDGHLSLVKIARARDACVVTSIFVNPLQFAPHEDFAEYPRTLERDCAELSAAGTDIVFAPTVEEIYPETQVTTLHPPSDLADILEGQVRPGFFRGVCTVVLKLFNIVQPKIAVFGRKDYQQQLIISNMIRQLALPIELIAGDIVRDTTGLSLSSRNSYLTESQRVEAAQLNRALCTVVAAIRAGRTDWSVIEQLAVASLRARGWQPDYVSIRRRDNLAIPAAGVPMVVLGAARIGGIRLIDNVEL